MDNVSKAVRRKIMRSVKQKDTAPELALRSMLFRRGCRFRVNYSQYKIDIAFVSKKIAIMVDGCFWHGCPLHGTIPKSNKRFWSKKLKRNMERDKEITRALELEGWKIIRIWEHELKKGILPKRIQRALS
ncbi:MAG: very short patch repair endonuclease [Candidatus Diapherotrites archaeon]